MELPRPNGPDIIRYSRKVAYNNLPTGAPKGKKCAVSAKWKSGPRKYKPSEMVEFSLKGNGKGTREDIIALGIKLAEEAITKGDKEFAKAVLMKIKTLD